MRKKTWINNIYSFLNTQKFLAFQQVAPKCNDRGLSLFQVLPRIPLSLLTAMPTSGIHVNQRLSKLLLQTSFAWDLN